MESSWENRHLSLHNNSDSSSDTLFRFRWGGGTWRTVTSRCKPRNIKQTVAASSQVEPLFILCNGLLFRNKRGLYFSYLAKARAAPSTFYPVPSEAGRFSLMSHITPWNDIDTGSFISHRVGFFFFLNQPYCKFLRHIVDNWTRRWESDRYPFLDDNNRR